jgi:prepilin-type N-terminal cleavage/methylation domain-containing protein
MKRNCGFTLIELTIVVLLLGVMGLITTAVIVNGFHRQAEIDGRAAAIQQVRTALQRTVREIRAADYPIYSLTNSRLVFGLSGSSGGTTQVCYDAATSAGGGMSLTRYVGGCTAATATSTSVVATHLATSNVFSVPYASAGYQPYLDLTTLWPDCEMRNAPGTYAQHCPGAINVRLMIIPVNANTGASVCPATASASSCDIDISDTAELRNAP